MCNSSVLYGDLLKYFIKSRLGTIKAVGRSSRTGYTVGNKVTPVSLLATRSKYFFLFQKERL